MDVRIPACCTNCGGLFPSRTVSITGGATVERLQVVDSFEVCPFCGGIARPSSAVFSVANDVLSLFRGSGLTPQKLEEVKATVSAAQKIGKAVTDLADDLEPLFPPLAEFARRWVKRGMAPSTLLLVVILAAIEKCSVSINADVSVDVNDLVRQLIGKEPPALTQPKK